jgi:hypothetical protein
MNLTPVSPSMAGRLRPAFKNIATLEESTAPRKRAAKGFGKPDNVCLLVVFIP